MISYPVKVNLYPLFTKCICYLIQSGKGTALLMWTPVDQSYFHPRYLDSFFHILIVSIREIDKRLLPYGFSFRAIAKFCISMFPHCLDVRQASGSSQEFLPAQMVFFESFCSILINTGRKLRNVLRASFHIHSITCAFEPTVSLLHYRWQGEKF